ncbi:hypothetical protein DFH09DRAFT_1108883 [Mycena vulgaris]|nr:hypothetical protein DFH09DRAFT_1108883 [Mycena vulgaris]
MWTKLCVRVELVRIGEPGASTGLARTHTAQWTSALAARDADAALVVKSVTQLARAFVTGVAVETSARCARSATRCGWGIDEWGMEEDTRIATYLGPGTVMSQLAACGGNVVLRRSLSILSMIPEGKGLNRVKGKNKPLAEILLCGQPQRAIGRRKRGERVMGNSLTQLQWPTESVESWRCWILHFSDSTGHGGESKERRHANAMASVGHTPFERHEPEVVGLARSATRISTAERSKSGVRVLRRFSGTTDMATSKYL